MAGFKVYFLSFGLQKQQLKILTKVDKGRLSHYHGWWRIFRQDFGSAEVSILKEDQNKSKNMTSAASVPTCSVMVAVWPLLSSSTDSLELGRNTHTHTHTHIAVKAIRDKISKVFSRDGKPSLL